MKFKSIDGRRVGANHDGELSPGEFSWNDEDGPVRELTFMVPGDEWGFIRTITCYRKGNHPGHVAWEWDGDMDKPTLNPSIAAKGAPDGKTMVWHGYLTAGRFEACE